MSETSILDEIDALQKVETDTEDKIRIANAKAEIKKLSKSSLAFPLDAFPKELQDIIKVFNQCYQLPIDFYAGSMLVAASTLIGNSYVVEYKYKWEYAPIMYMAIVGMPGSGKTPAIKSMLAPLFKLEEEYAKEHKQEVEKWKQQCFEKSLLNSKEPQDKRPDRMELIINDATLEAINACLSKNPKGLLLYQDELRAWINSMNKYRSGAGSDNEFWLSNWSSASVKVNRQGKDPLYIKRPYVNTIGGIQPGVLGDMVGGGKSESGFLARILFIYPDLMTKPYDTDVLPDHSVYEAYNKVLKKLNNLPTRIKRPTTDYEEWTVENIKLKMDDDALVLYKQFLKENTDAINKSDDETVKGIYVKMESYCLRFALVLQLLYYCCGNKYQIKTIDEAQKMKISKKNIKGAIQLVNYFKKTAFKVIMRFDSPVNELPAEKKIFYEALPERFKTKEAVSLGLEIAEIKERTVKRLLNDRKLFKRIAQGEYEKNYI